MTSLTLAQRLARHLSPSDLTLLPARAVNDLLAAAKAGVQEVSRFFPPASRITTVSDILRAPAEVAVTIVERYGNSTINAPFTDRQRGCTVKICDDPAWNEVVASNAFLDSYLGAVLEGTATVYGDCIQLPAVFERMSGDVLLYRSESDSFDVLTRNDEIQPAQRCSLGTPRHYSIETTGSGQGGEPGNFVRVHPIPDRDFRIRMDVELAAFELTFLMMLREPVELPFGDQHCESIVVPICTAHLLTSEFWRDSSTKPLIKEAAALARDRMLPRVPVDVSPGGNWIGTPPGY